jgi:hypothetical protein
MSIIALSDGKTTTKDYVKILKFTDTALRWRSRRVFSAWYWLSQPIRKKGKDTGMPFLVTADLVSWQMVAESAGVKKADALKVKKEWEKEHPDILPWHEDWCVYNSFGSPDTIKINRPTEHLSWAQQFVLAVAKFSVGRPITRKYFQTYSGLSISQIDRVLTQLKRSKIINYYTIYKHHKKSGIKITIPSYDESEIMDIIKWKDTDIVKIVKPKSTVPNAEMTLPKCGIENDQMTLPTFPNAEMRMTKCVIDTKRESMKESPERQSTKDDLQPGAEASHSGGGEDGGKNCPIVSYSPDNELIDLEAYAKLLGLNTDDRKTELFDRYHYVSYEKKNEIYKKFLEQYIRGTNPQ